MNLEEKIEAAKAQRNGETMKYSFFVNPTTRYAEDAKGWLSPVKQPFGEYIEVEAYADWHAVHLAEKAFRPWDKRPITYDERNMIVFRSGKLLAGDSRSGPRAGRRRYG